MMNDEDSPYAIIPPVADRLERPEWSVLIPCFNCAGFLEATLSSVMAQDPGPARMEIIVVDDCSDKDDPGEVVKRVGGDRVRLLQQSQNVGKVRNYEAGLLASRGRFIHQLHGDDLVLPGFYSAMEDAFSRHLDAGAFFCESDYIDASGQVTGRTGSARATTGLLETWLPKIATAQRIQTPSMVVRRAVYEDLGGFDRRLDCSEDWEMWIRIANKYAVGFCSEARAQYRTSPGNNSSRSILNGRRGEVQRLMFKIVDEYLPQKLVKEIRRKRARGQAEFFAGQIPHVMKARGLADTIRLIREVFRFGRNVPILRRVGAMILKGLRN
jgi:glycosyltransferase involved in cell wall biosynthesis